jgi:hypothetical protein
MKQTKLFKVNKKINNLTNALENSFLKKEQRFLMVAELKELQAKAKLLSKKKK